uniref:Uncharacterized protein n=1 Tax=Oryza sativa subsp. japonica TaxID=39947 RepID=Q8GZY9_ORYSJ|nr:Hypothetical protein [Oryza sativa Japonica Group]
MDTLLGSGRFLARRPPLALAPRCSRGSPEKGGGSDKDMICVVDHSSRVIQAPDSFDLLRLELDV